MHSQGQEQPCGPEFREAQDHLHLLLPPSRHAAAMTICRLSCGACSPVPAPLTTAVTMVREEGWFRVDRLPLRLELEGCLARLKGPAQGKLSNQFNTMAP